MRKSYATDLSDSEWAYLRSRLSELPKTIRTRTHSLRDIFDAIFYVLKTGCHWRLLPHDFPPWQTVFYHYRRLRLNGMWHRIFAILRGAERKRAGKDPDACAAIMDSQSIKTTEECAKPDAGVYDAHANGYDAHKNVKGRKRHLLVDTLGLPLSVYVSPANVQDRVGARLLLAGLAPLVPRLEKIWADGAYGGEPLAQWCREEGGWDLEIVERDPEAEGFEVIPKRWLVQRTISWIGRNRKMSKDYERKVQTSETLIELAMIRLILRRLARQVCPLQNRQALRGPLCHTDRPRSQAGNLEQGGARLAGLRHPGDLLYRSRLRFHLESHRAGRRRTADAPGVPHAR